MSPSPCCSCCPALACLHGKGALDHAVRAFQSPLHLKYTSLSRFFFFFSKIIILVSAAHSALLHIDMALLTCGAELALSQGKVVLSSPDLISHNLISSLPQPLLGCGTGKPLPKVKKGQTCTRQGGGIWSGHLTAVLQHHPCARSLHSFRRNSSWQCCKVLSAALDLLWLREKQGQKNFL